MSWNVASEFMEIFFEGLGGVVGGEGGGLGCGMWWKFGRKA